MTVAVVTLIALIVAFSAQVGRAPAL